MKMNRTSMSFCLFAKIGGFMRGDAKPLVKMLQGAETRFIVPVYQRNYDWKHEQCKKLFDDLEEVVAENRSSHFFGSIVSKADMERRILIDGQQRVTTTFLLLAALLKQIEDGNIACERPRSVANYIRDEWLIDKYDETEKLKLKLIRSDQRAFKKVIEGNAEELVEGSNVTENYRYFLGRIMASELTAEQLRDAVKRLTVIDIRLEDDDDAQLIFESLNSTGLDLSEGDKIRNYVLMGLSETEQERFFEKYWRPMEQNTDYNVSGFIRDYLTCKNRKAPVISKVYLEFKLYAQGRDTEALLGDLLRFSKFYRQVLIGSCGSAGVDSILKRLNLLEMGVMNPFLLNALAARCDGEVGDADLVEAFSAVETYVFRRWVCQVPTNALNTVFETLHWDAMKGVEDGQGYANALKYALLRRDGAGRLPNDNEFKEAYDSRDFYRINRKRLYLYDRLENGDNVERVNVVEMLEDDVLSVEHIMPQTLSRQWQEALGADASEEIHSRFVNMMGNLTLTGYNSQYSNNLFVDKRDREHGFKDSGLKLNRFVSACDTWGIREIEKRHEAIWNMFLALWPMPKSTYRPKAVERESHSLDEDFSFTGLKPAAYTLQGVRRSVKTWVSVMEGVLPALYEIDPVATRKVALGDKFPARYFSSSRPDYGFEIGGGIWYNPGCSTVNKLEALRKIIDRMVTVDQSDLAFEVYGNDEESN